MCCSLLWISYRQQQGVCCRKSCLTTAILSFCRGNSGNIQLKKQRNIVEEYLWCKCYKIHTINFDIWNFFPRFTTCTTQNKNLHKKWNLFEILLKDAVRHLTVVFSKTKQYNCRGKNWPLCFVLIVKYPCNYVSENTTHSYLTSPCILKFLSISSSP